MIRTILLAALAAALLTPPVARADPPNPASPMFGRLFPELAPLTGPTNQQLADLAQTMLDPNADADNNPNVPSVITYGGQFADHDITLDLQPPPDSQVDPTTLRNFRTPKFDLDSVYGDGPDTSPQLYEPDGLHLRVQNPNPNGVRDLPRNPDGTAIVGDGRNDENQIISQLHVAFLLAHNRLIDMGLKLQQARRRLTRHWQRILLDEYLPDVAGPNRVDAVIRGHHGDPQYYRPDPDSTPTMPVEFSVACFRFGHSEVRRAYEVNENTGKIQVFSFTQPDLRGGREIQAGRQIEWGNFAAELTDPDDADGINLTRRIDTLISSSLFQLPIPGAEATGSNVLAFRNMTRAQAYGLPSYETVARRVGVNPVPLDLGPGFENGTPLWYGMLAESQQTENGLRLGPTCGQIVTDVFVGIMAADEQSVLNEPDFKLDERIAGDDNHMTFSDLLLFAGVAEPPDDEQP